MKFNLVKVDEKDKNIIYNLMQLYTYELSFFEDETATFTMLDSGLYAMSKYVERYWQEENRHPYILKCDKIVRRHKYEHFTLHVECCSVLSLKDSMQ